MASPPARKPRPPATAQGRRGFLVLGNKLFDPARLADYRDARFYMAEDLELCTMDAARRRRIFAAAETFLQAVTISSAGT